MNDQKNKSVILFVPDETKNRPLLLAAASQLVASAGAEPTIVGTIEDLEENLRLTPTTVTLAVAPSSLERFAATIEILRSTRKPERPATRFVVLSAQRFERGARPIGVQLCPLERRDLAKAALEHALETAESEERETLRRTVARI